MAWQGQGCDGMGRLLLGGFVETHNQAKIVGVQHRMSVEYAKIASGDHDRDDYIPHEEEDVLHPGIVHAIRNDNPFPISKPPTKYRDPQYGLLFIIHFIGIIVLTMFESSSMRHSVLNYGRAGSWASIVMSLTLLSTVCGCLLFFLFKSAEFRSIVISYGIIFSFILKICIGNILLIMRSHFSFLGVFVLLSAFFDSGRMKPARVSLGFTGTLMQLALDVNTVYGLSLTIACMGIVAAQTCVLLWWGSFYIGMISTVHPGIVVFMTLIMAFSLYWTAQFFHHFIGFVVGGCTLYYFVRNQNEPIDKSSRILLYLKCGLTTSFGSLCKAAIFVMPAQFVLHCHSWIVRNMSQAGSCYRLLFCFSYFGDGLVSWARKYNKLTIPSLAVYGRTLYSTADDQLTFYPGTLQSSQEDYTSYSLGCIATCVAGVISILFGLMAEAKHLYSWPLFFVLCFYLTYFGVSISLHIYSSAVDAFVLAAAINPDQFAKENQLVLLRFMRTGDPELQQV